MEHKDMKAKKEGERRQGIIRRSWKIW